MELKRTEGGMETIRNIYKFGRGPSSSHTMGPEKACKIAMTQNDHADYFEVILYGSLAKTGIGHRTDYAIRQTFGKIPVNILFNTDEKNLPHPNTMKISAFYHQKKKWEQVFISVGGGEIEALGHKAERKENIYDERTFSDVEAVCLKKHITIQQYVEMCEGVQIRKYMSDVWKQMKDTVSEGLKASGTIPGGLGIKRKASRLFDMGRSKEFGHEKEIYLVSSYAYAASEQNASGEKMVTAPTCGASGALPAVLIFKQQELGYDDEKIISALEVAGFIGNLVKTNASVSGALCGCQAEIGTSCAMAAAAFATLKGLDIKQIECAAEIALEHHLGLTCDPVGGLVQIPCIERNAVAAMRAIDAVSLAQMLYEDRKISFDTVVKTMYETGRDLSCRYRETSEGGLASNYVSEVKK